MATNAVSDVSIGSSNRSTSRRNVSRPYRAPTLVKGPVLSVITAEPVASGTPAFS